MESPTACEAHEKGDPLSIFKPHSCSTLSDIPAAMHSVPPPIGLHKASLSLSSPVEICLLFLPLGLADLDIKPGQPWFHVRIVLFPPQCHLHVTLHHTPNFKSPLLK